MAFYGACRNETTFSSTVTTKTVDRSGYIDLEAGECETLLPTAKESGTTKQEWKSMGNGKFYSAIFNPKVFGLVFLLLAGISIGTLIHMRSNVKPTYNAELTLVEPENLTLSLTPFARRVQSTVLIVNTKFPACYTRKECEQVIQNAAPELPHNFLIGGDGNVYQIRGWSHQSLFKNEGFTIGFIGDFTSTFPDERMFDVTKSLIAEAVRRRRLFSNYQINGLQSNRCDGKALFHMLQNWSHWRGFIKLI